MSKGVKLRWLWAAEPLRRAGCGSLSPVSILQSELFLLALHVLQLVLFSLPENIFTYGFEYIFLYSAGLQHKFPFVLPFSLLVASFLPWFSLESASMAVGLSAHQLPLTLVGILSREDLQKLFV